VCWKGPRRRRAAPRAIDVPAASCCGDLQRRQTAQGLPYLRLPHQWSNISSVVDLLARSFSLYSHASCHYEEIAVSENRCA